MPAVLITGSSGLLGRALVRELNAAGYAVSGADRNAPGHQAPCTRITGDCRDFFREDRTRFDAVIHCAAITGGRERLERDPLAYAANIETDAAFFGWAARTRPGYALYVSSCNAYPASLGNGRPLAETDLDASGVTGTIGAPDGIYGWAKLTGEYLALQAGVAVARPFSIYGPGQAPGFAVSNFAAQARERRDPIEVWGTGAQVRDFMHVSDVAGALAAMVKDRIAGPVNIASGTPVTLMEAAALAASTAGYEPEIRTVPGMPEGLPCRYADAGILHGFFRPSVALDAGIRELVNG